MTAVVDAVFLHPGYQQNAVRIVDGGCSISVRALDAENHPTRSVMDASEMHPGEWWVNRVVVEPASERGKGTGTAILFAGVQYLFQKRPELQRICVCPGGYGSDPDKQWNFYVKNGFTPAVDDESVLERRR